ncbi:hypothetical protein Y032_0205g1934 [Ancylostoma ceylanicum]|uniref:Uncharacterized protein n=1 Tax=Ancylostoma ceylanicum TaxID=53326 RepID=A0A016SLL7_9BILA|nr:hypothetical protein Y032_0205g1934 [Ancylostoma ceylanicum]
MQISFAQWSLCAQESALKICLLYYYRSLSETGIHETSTKPTVFAVVNCLIHYGVSEDAKFGMVTWSHPVMCS